MMHRDMKGQPILRRPKARPCDDFWHTLAVGIPIAAILFVVLPVIFNLAL